MCRRGGSKGGKHSDDVTDINVGNTAMQNQTKSNPVEQTPTGSFLLPKWGGFESKRKNRGNDYPCGKIKIL